MHTGNHSAADAIDSPLSQLQQVKNHSKIAQKSHLYPSGTVFSHIYIAEVSKGKDCKVTEAESV